MKKIYTIRITATDRLNIWYAKRTGEIFEATLTAKTDRVVVFEVNPCWFVHLVDCEIIGERVVKKYEG